MYGPQPRLHPTRSCSIPPASPHSRAPWQHPAPTTAAAGYLKRPRDTDAVVREDRGFRGYVGKCQSNSRSIVLQLKTSVIRSSKLTPKIGGLRKQHGGGCEHQQYGANWAHHVWTKPHFWTNPHGKSPSLHLGFLQKKMHYVWRGFMKFSGFKAWTWSKMRDSKIQNGDNQTQQRYCIHPNLSPRFLLL